MTEGRDGINVWLAYCDLFAGMLIVFAVFYGTQLEQERAAKKELQRAQNKAVALLDRVAANINKRYGGTDKEVKSDGTQLLLPSDTTFESGSYRVREESKRWLIAIGGEMRRALDGELGPDRHSMTIEILGHTDAWPVKAGQVCIPTNWELSSRRATEIVRLFQDNNVLDPSTFRVFAIGAAEYDQYEMNYNDQANRVLKKSEELIHLRRIEIRITPNVGELLKSVSTKP